MGARRPLLSARVDELERRVRDETTALRGPRETGSRLLVEQTSLTRAWVEAMVRQGFVEPPPQMAAQPVVWPKTRSTATVLPNALRDAPATSREQAGTSNARQSGAHGAMDGMPKQPPHHGNSGKSRRSASQR